MAGKRTYNKVPKRPGVYCLKFKATTKSTTRCVQRLVGGKTKFLKSGNIKCGCHRKVGKRTGR